MMNLMKGSLLLTALVCSQFTWAGGDSIAIKYAATITAEDLSRHLHIVAADSMEGRETGLEGQKKAAAYIAGQFEKMGLEPIVEGSYFQPVPLKKVDPNGVTVTIKERTYSFLHDFYFYGGFKDQIIDANEVAFAGYGISEENYDDYASIDVAGKIVMVLDKEPKDKAGKSIISGERQPSSWTLKWDAKMNAAMERDAKALLVVVSDFDKRVGRMRKYLEEPSLELDRGSEAGFPVLYISEQMAVHILGQSEKSLAKIKSKIKKKGVPVTQLAEGKIQLNITRKVEYLMTENVLGYIEGTDLKDEVVVITAHYDHVGMDGDDIYNGADDDGSGTVAVLELAEAFMKAKQAGNGARRSVLIMTVSGEEKGLLGSEWYTDHPIIPLENTIVDLNIDMIGRQDEKHERNPDYVYLIGSDRLSSELHQISEEANANHTQLELDYTFNAPDDPNQFYSRSDHYNFAKHNIPVIFYFNGTHDDYHKPTDTVDKIHFEKMEKITRLVFFTAWEVANRNDRLMLHSN